MDMTHFCSIGGFFMDKFKFPTLDGVTDYDKAKGPELEFRTYDMQPYLVFLVLPLVWSLCMLAHNSLNVMPVPKGNVDSTMIFHLCELMFSKLGILWVVLKPVAVLLSVGISSLLAFFFHASFPHAFTNMILYVGCVGLCIWFNLKVKVLFKQFISLSFFGIMLPWISVYFLGFILSKIHITKNWMVAVSNSKIPIVGASVGLFGLLGLFLIITVMNLGKSRWNSLILIVLGTVTFALLGQQVLNYMNLSSTISSMGSTTVLVIVMHFTGYILGLIYGFTHRYQFVIR